MTATPPKPSLVKTPLAKAQTATNRLNALVPTIPSQFSPVTVYQAGTSGVGAQLSAPTSAFPMGTGFYGTWVAPDLNNGQPYTIQVECFGGGGGGGGGSTTTGGGGGGGGEYAAETAYPVIPGKSYVWSVGTPGSAGSANSDNNQGATAGGTGGVTVFDVAGIGVAGGVTAYGGTGGDVGNVGNGGSGGSGSTNSVDYWGGAGGTNIPGNGGGSGGQGGTDNPFSLYTAGYLQQPPVAWYVLNDSGGDVLINDSSGNSQVATAGSAPGSGGFAYAQGGAASQVPAYQLAADPPSSPNPTTAGTQFQLVMTQLNQQSAYVQCPGFSFSGDALTFSGWVMPNPDPNAVWGNTTPGTRAVIAANCTGYADSSTAGFALYLSNTGAAPSAPAWELIYYLSDGTNAYTVSTALPVDAGVPQYIVATFSASTMTLYLNGNSQGTASTAFSSVPAWPTVAYGFTFGCNPNLSVDWFFGYLSNFWFAQSALSSAGVSQAYNGTGESSAGGGAGGGASGGPDANGGAGAAGSGSDGGAGGTPATQPAAIANLTTPGSAGIAGAASGSGNSGVNAGPGAGGGGAGESTSPPVINTINVPFITAAAYCGTDASGGAAGTVYNPVIEGTTGYLFTGGQSSETTTGSKNSLLILPPGLAASLAGTSVLRVTLTVYSANFNAIANSLLEVGWSNDTFLPVTYDASDIIGSAGVMELSPGDYAVTADLTESQLGLYIQQGTATALVLGPGGSPTFDAYNATGSGPYFYNAIYGPGSYDSAGNPLYPYLTITYAESATVQQGSPGSPGAILLTYLNQANSLVGSWNAASGLNAFGGQVTETSVVLGSTIPATSDSARLGGALTPALSTALGQRLGASATPGSSPGAVLGYTSGATTVTETVAGTYTFTVPADVTSLTVECWGAGGAGWGGNSNAGQGGGGGGAYSQVSAYAVTPGDVITYVVGAGGSGQPVGGGTSTLADGEDSVFDTTNVAGAGVRGRGGQHHNVSLNYGPGGAITTGMTISNAGGNGGTLASNQPTGSGGGGSSGSGGRGGAGSANGAAGAAGSGGGAAGGAGVSNGSGEPGSAPGGGGGGASAGSSGFSGGNGADGQVSITYVSSAVLNTSVATAAGTDGAGNTYPAGVMTNALTVTGDTTFAAMDVTGALSAASLDISGDTTLTGVVAAGGNLTVAGAISGPSSSTLTVGESLSVGDNLTVTGSLSAGSGSVGNNFQVFGHLLGNSGGTLEVQATISCSALEVNGVTLSMNQSAPSTVGSAPSSYSDTFEDTLSTAINSIISKLQSAGIFS